MFRTWITKQVAVAHFNGTNRQLSWWDKLVKNVCPNCQQAGESTSHIKRCTAIGHQTIFKESVGELRIWLQKEQTDQVVTKLICKYLEGHGETTMESLLVCKDSKYAMVVWIHDKLGWDNFLEGRICSAWLHLRQDNIMTRNLRRSAGKWMMKNIVMTVRTRCNRSLSWAYELNIRIPRLSRPYRLLCIWQPHS